MPPYINNEHCEKVDLSYKHPFSHLFSDKPWESGSDRFTKIHDDQKMACLPQARKILVTQICEPLTKRLLVPRTNGSPVVTLGRFKSSAADNVY